MEIFLQWLDDVDDAVFVLASRPERLRRVALLAGSWTVTALAACQLLLGSGSGLKILGPVALGCVTIWSAVTLASVLARGRVRRPAIG